MPTKMLFETMTLTTLETMTPMTREHYPLFIKELESGRHRQIQGHWKAYGGYCVRGLAWSFGFSAPWRGLTGLLADTYRNDSVEDPWSFIDFAARFREELGQSKLRIKLARFIARIRYALRGQEVGPL